MLVPRIFILTLLVAPTVHAATPKIPELLKTVEAKYAKASTLTAEFTQLNHLAAMDQDKKSSGKILVKRPDKFRWETTQPDTNLLVTDGKTFWFYTPPFDEGERGQLIERKSSQVQSRMASTLLSGSFSVNREMKITQDGASRFVLTPKKGTAGTVKRALVEVDAKNLLIEKVILEHTDGNRAEITLTHIQLGEKLSDDIFIFKAPANTDRITE